MTQYFDTHAHYDDTRFDSDRAELLRTLHTERGVEYIINPGCTLEASQKAVELSERYDFIYAAAGLHPEAADTSDAGALQKIAALAVLPKVVAIGEIGLDYHYDTPKDKQQRLFTAQMELARELSKPVIIHDREAHGDCLETVRAFPELKGVFHCYSGSAEMVTELIRLGYYISFTGTVTFTNARKNLEAVRAVPLDRFFIETDAPYLAPHPYRGQRNDSGFLSCICESIGAVKNETAENIARISLENARAFFGIC